MRMNTLSLPNVPSVSSDIIEAEHKDIKIDILNDDVKAFDATQTHAQVPAPMQAQVHPNDNVKDNVNLVNSVV